MLTYALKRILFALPVAFGVATAVFFFMQLLPGNPADLIFGDQALAADKAAWLSARGLDQPLLAQYGRYLSGLVRGDLGNSFLSDVSVAVLVRERFPATLLLACWAMVFAILAAFPLGMAAAVWRGRLPDHASRVLSLSGISLPTLASAPLLMLFFAVYLGWFPVSGRVLPRSFVLPSLALGIAMAAFLSRIVRASLIDVLGEDFVRTARAKGLPFAKVLTQHALKAAMVPIGSVLGLQFGALLAGAVVTETIFAWPGMGSLLVESIQKRDYSVVQACVLVMSLSYVIVNLAVDLVFARLDPRIALKGGGR